MHKYIAQQWLPVSVEHAWDFFSSPHNLGRITPPEMDFKVLTGNLGVSIHNGMLIDYSVKPILGIATSWRTEIISVMEQKSFTDKQVKGPYKFWEHSHRFEERNGGVMMTDEVIYQLPFGSLGLLFHWLYIRSKIESIFEYRKKILNTIFEL
jgi:ligand-binding SRPBCC domain-containing protein